MGTIKYFYDPALNRLTILSGEQVKGHFVGEIANKKFFELIQQGIDVTMGEQVMKSAKIKKLRALWIKQGCDMYRDAILEPYKVCSTKDLTEAQLDELIARFTHSSKTDASKEVRTARSIVLALLTELGIYDNSGDWTRVNEFLMNKRIAGKMLFQMNVDEMKQLQIKLRAIIVKNNTEKKQLNNQIINN